MDTICDVVAMVVEREDFRTSEDSVKRLDNMALRCDVEAALSSDDKIWSSGHRVAVTAHDGVISLRGTTKNKELRNLILDAASKVEGVVDCKSEIAVLTDALR
jgi:osmotically-inducible protein OsmY